MLFIMSPKLDILPPFLYFELVESTICRSVTALYMYLCNNFIPVAMPDKNLEAYQLIDKGLEITLLRTFKYWWLRF